MNEVKMPEGYKQTEIGVIPEDWEVKDIGEALTIRHGKDQKQVESTRGQYPIFGTGGQMGWANDFLYNKPSVLIGRKGSINKPRYINVPFWTVDTLFYSQVHNGYDEKFMFYKFCLIDWMNYNEASGVPSLNASTISNVKISVPKKPEQTAIAIALSDVDNLIGSLEKLIAKKEAIKTGTMQQLLTGKTRLPEFATHADGSPKGFKQTELGRVPEDWEVKSYADIFTFLSTSSNSRADLSNSGDYGYIHYGDIHTKWHTRLDLSKTSLPKISENLVTSAFVQHGDIVIADASEDYEGVGKSIEISNQSSKPVVSGLHTFLLRDKNEQLSDGFRGLINDIPVVKASIQRLATGLKVYGISKKNLITVMIPVPDKKEQTAIATVLSDMDTEIQALQQRLAKTEDLKQGMMQQLLTGKVRLVH